MLPDLAADEGFIHFDFAVGPPILSSSKRAALHDFPNALKHEPCRRLRHAAERVQVRAN